MTENRIPLKPMLGCERIVALSISSHEHSLKPSLPFSDVVGSLYF